MTTRARLVLPLLMLVSAASAAADVVDDWVRKGIDQLYAVEFDAASRSFDQAIAADPSDPRGYFFSANVHLWSYLFDKRQEQLDQFFAASDKAIRAAEGRISVNPRDSRARLFLGMSYGYKTIANARAENFMAAALSARACYDKLNDLVHDDPRAYDAYLGLGLFHFLFGSVPKVGQFIAGLNGIKGDAKLGIKEIETVASRGTYFRNDAQLIIALVNIYYVNDLARGVAALEGLAKRYPKNVAMAYAIGSAYQAQNMPERAIPYYERVVQLGNADFSAVTNLSLMRLGAAHLACNDIARAKPFLKRFLQDSRETMFRAWGWYLLGLCFDLEGNHANAAKSYAYALKAPSPASEDRTARRRAALLIKTPMTDVDRTIARALNATMASHWNEALGYANSVTALRDLSPAQRAQAFYATGQALEGTGAWARAIDAYRTAVTSGHHSETWVQPFSYLHMAACYLKLGDKERWHANIELARGFNGYDGETQIRFEIERDVTLID